MKKLFFLYSFFVFVSCSVDPEIKPIAPSNDVKEIIPNNWPTPNYNFSNNPLTQDGFILGRTLFYDPILSSDNTISCGSCHQQFVAFANAGHSLSHGVGGKLGTRNAPALQNLNWNPSFLHDGGVNHIEVFPPAPMTNPLEMNETLDHVVSKIAASGKYAVLFKKAFGKEEVTTQKMFKAIAQFMGTMYSYNSKYDQMKEGKISFTPAEQRGYELFSAKCASCHKEPLFSDYEYRSNGLDVSGLNDSGRAHITGLPTDKFKFKTPSLRNIEKTGPYMHDGRFSSLDQCLEHYISGISNLINLDPSLNSGISLTPDEKNDIIIFLKTLTDNTFLTDKRYSETN